MPSPINLPTVPANDDQLPARVPLVPERSDFLEDDAPTANKVEAFLAQALAATGTDAPTTAGALVPWICDALLSNHSVKAYGRDLLEAIPADTLQGIRDLAMMSVFFLTGCRVSAVVGACVGHLETDGIEHYLHVTESLRLGRCCRGIGQCRVQNSPTIRAIRSREHACCFLSTNVRTTTSRSTS